MKVQRAEESAGPGYPDLKEVLINRHLLGAAALGAGVMVSACAPPPRTGGVPLPHSGNTAPVEPAHSNASKPKDTGGHHHLPPIPSPQKNLASSEEPYPPTRVPGAFSVVPQAPPQPEHLPPPRLGGVPPRR